MSDTSSTAGSIRSDTSTPNTTPLLASPTASSIMTFVEPPQSLIPRKWLEEGVRSIGLSEVREAALSLSQAFASDDLANYLLPEDTDDLTKWNLHLAVMKYTVAAHCLTGLVTTSGFDYEGVALWTEPGKNTENWWTIFRSGMWKLYYKLSREGRGRFFNELYPLLHKTKAEVMGDRDNDCYYLVYLGTKPRCRGQGYGKRLILDMAKKADAENRPMYLESSNVANNSYYRKFGFEERREIFLARGPVPVQLTIMVREPRPLKSNAVSAPTSVPKLSTPVPARYRSRTQHKNLSSIDHGLKEKLFGHKA